MNCKCLLASSATAAFFIITALFYPAIADDSSAEDLNCDITAGQKLNNEELKQVAQTRIMEAFALDESRVVYGVRNWEEILQQKVATFSVIFTYDMPQMCQTIERYARNNRKSMLIVPPPVITRNHAWIVVVIN